MNTFHLCGQQDITTLSNIVMENVIFPIQKLVLRVFSQCRNKLRTTALSFSYLLIYWNMSSKRAHFSTRSLLLLSFPSVVHLLPKPVTTSLAQLSPEESCNVCTPMSAYMQVVHLSVWRGPTMTSSVIAKVTAAYHRPLPQAV